MHLLHACWASCQWNIWGSCILVQAKSQWLSVFPHLKAYAFLLHPSIISVHFMLFIAFFGALKVARGQSYGDQHGASLERGEIHCGLNYNQLEDAQGNIFPAMLIINLAKKIWLMQNHKGIWFKLKRNCGHKITFQSSYFSIRQMIYIRSQAVLVRLKRINTRFLIPGGKNQNISSQSIMGLCPIPQFGFYLDCCNVSETGTESFHYLYNKPNSAWSQRR